MTIPLAWHCQSAWPVFLVGGTSFNALLHGEYQQPTGLPRAFVPLPIRCSKSSPAWRRTHSHVHGLFALAPGWGRASRDMVIICSMKSRDKSSSMPITLWFVRRVEGEGIGRFRLVRIRKAGWGSIQIQVQQSLSFERFRNIKSWRTLNEAGFALCWILAINMMEATWVSK